MLAGTERFIVEFWRLNPKLALGLTGAQWVSLILGAIGLVGMALSARRAAAEAPALRRS